MTKEKYMELTSALKEQNKKQTAERQAGKLKHKALQRVVSNCATRRWDYWNHPEYKVEREKIGKWNCLTQEQLTLFHILYNRIRKRTPHTGSYESDQAYIKEHNSSWAGCNHYNKLIENIGTEFGIVVDPDTGDLSV